MKSMTIPIEQIRCDPEWNSRGVITAYSTQELSEEISSQGLINPITVRELGDKYEVIAGFRRFMAVTKNLGWKEIPCNNLGKISDDQALLINMSENIGRDDLDLLQEAEVVQRFLDKGYTQKEVADMFHRSVGWIQNRLMALKMPKEIRALIKSGQLNASQVRELYRYIHNSEELKQAVNQAQKDADAGVKKIKLKLPKKDTKRVRTVEEKKELLKDLTSQGLDGIICDVLRWCLGQLTTEELKKKGNL